jgi:hypothetical protein
MHKNATKCNKTLSKWCRNNHGASKIIDTFETYQVQRVFLPHRAHHLEDYAIITVTLVPEGQVNCADVRDVLVDFLSNNVMVGYKEVQKCPFG